MAIRRISRPGLKNLSVTRLELLQRLDADGDGQIDLGAGPDLEAIQAQIDGLVSVNESLQTSNLTGFFRVGDRHTALTPIDNTKVNTGHSLTQSSGSILKIKFQDETGIHSWQAFEIDVDDVIERFNRGGTLVEQSLTIFDNDHVQVHVDSQSDLDSGVLRFFDVGRHMSYLWSELYIPAVVLAIGSSNTTNWPGATGQVLQSNGDGTFTFVNK